MVTVKINNGTELERFRDILAINGKDSILAFTSEFGDGEPANSGYLSYNDVLKRWYLTKVNVGTAISIEAAELLIEDGTLG